MAKPKKAAKGDVPQAPPPSEAMTSRGKALAAAGGVFLLLGLGVLSRAGEGGQDRAASLAPLLIVAGYAVLGVGLSLPPQPPPPSSPS